LLDYFGDVRSFKILTPDQTNRYMLRYGKAEFTQTGEQLSRIAGAESLPGFWTYTQSIWQEQGVRCLGPYQKRLIERVTGRYRDGFGNVGSLDAAAVAVLFEVADFVRQEFIGDLFADVRSLHPI
jgi:hypothetical protein